MTGDPLIFLDNLHPDANCSQKLLGKFSCSLINDGLVKSRNSIEFVIPAKAGIQLFQDVLDPGFRRDDVPRDFLRDRQAIIYSQSFD
jgi:hypothetical protein